MEFGGHTGTDFTGGAHISARSVGAWTGPLNHTGALSFHTSGLGDLFPQERMVIDPKGNVAIGHNNPLHLLDLAGNLNFRSIDSLLIAGTFGTPGQVLTAKAGGGMGWTTPTTGGTASNGLNMVGSDVRLGGTIDNPTNIDISSETITFDATFSGNPIILKMVNREGHLHAYGMRMQAGTEAEMSAGGGLNPGDDGNPIMLMAGTGNDTGTGGEALLTAGDGGSSGGNGGDVTIRSGFEWAGAGGRSGNINIAPGFSVSGNYGNTHIAWDATNNVPAGRLGVGTNNPTARLHLDGDFRYVDGNQGPGRVLTSDANGNANWAPAVAGTASNGLYMVGSDVRIGGVLNQSTVVDVQTNNLELFAASTSNGMSVVGDVGYTRVQRDGLYGYGDAPTLVRAANSFNNSFPGYELDMRAGNGYEITNGGSLWLSAGRGGSTLGRGGNTYLYGGDEVGGGGDFSGNVFIRPGQSASTKYGDVILAWDEVLDKRLGNVGIGTSTPNQALHIRNGYIRMEQGAAAGYVLTSDANGVGTWQPASGGWGLTGNAGTAPATDFLGTTDNAALNLRANNNRVAQFGAYDVATGSPTILMGYSANTATLALNGSFIGSGGNLGNPNRVTDNYNAIVGGSGNRAGNLNASPSDAQYGFIGGGFGNTVANFYATIVGGQGNTANGEYTSMVGGQNNLANSNYTTVVGGSNNAARGFASSALSGTDNISLGNYSLIPGGIQNRARSFGEVVVGIYNDTLGYTGTANLNVATDRIFTIGNGTGLASRSNAMVVLKNGNVGLGTSTPAQRLHVVGGFQLQNGTENTGRVLTSDALGNASWVTPNVANGASVNQTLRWDGLAWAPNSMLRVGNPPSGVGINAAPSTSYFLWVDDTKIGTTPGVFFRSTAAQGVGGVNIPLQLQVSNAPTSVGLDVIGSAAATETVTGVRVAVSGAGTRYAATFLGGRVGVGTTTPTSTLQVDGSTSVAVLNTNTAFTFTETHNVIIHSATTNNTLNLPLANTCPGRIYTIKKTTTSNTSLRLAPAGADTVEGVAANYDPGISLAKTSYSVVSDGVSGWWVIHKSLNN